MPHQAHADTLIAYSQPEIHMLLIPSARNCGALQIWNPSDDLHGTVGWWLDTAADTLY